MITQAAHAPRWARALLLVLPSIWVGLIIGISFIEAPLKFTAPGITIPLGLGIGRRVFFAMNLVEIVIGLVLLFTMISVWRSHNNQPVPGFTVQRTYGFIAIGLLIIKTAVIRPLLAVHTDAVLAGEFSGGSSTHYYYIAVEGVLFIVLILLIINVVRNLLAPTQNTPAART